MDGVVAIPTPSKPCEINRSQPYDEHIKISYMRWGGVEKNNDAYIDKTHTCTSKRKNNLKDKCPLKKKKSRFTFPSSLSRGPAFYPYKVSTPSFVGA